MALQRFQVGLVSAVEGQDVVILLLVCGVVGTIAFWIAVLAWRKSAYEFLR
jgi:hypothetical protein